MLRCNLQVGLQYDRHIMSIIGPAEVEQNYYTLYTCEYTI